MSVTSVANQLLLILSYLVPFLSALYIFWQQSRKDGFNEEESFDLIFSGTFFSAFITLVYSFSKYKTLNLFSIIPSPLAIVFGFIAGVCFFALKKSWSIYRVLDEISLSLLFGSGFYVLLLNARIGIKPLYVLAPILIFLVFFLLLKLRQTIAKSGFLYCLVSFVFCLAAWFVYWDSLSDLIFVFALFTLTIVVLISRLRMLYGKSKVNDRTTHNT